MPSMESFSARFALALAMCAVSPMVEAVAPAASECVSGWTALPPNFEERTRIRGGCFRVVPHASGRFFGKFEEKTLMVDKVGRRVFDKVCHQGGFTQGYDAATEPNGETKMYKIPVMLLVMLVLGLGKDQQRVVDSLCGAFPICMQPAERTAMNVIVGRHSNGRGGFALDKFSLYYPSNAAASEKWGPQNWPLIDGFAFRTAIFSGGIHAARRVLGQLQMGGGSLVTDHFSEYEDTMYFNFGVGNLSDAQKLQAIRADVTSLLSDDDIHNLLAPSYDPTKSGMTAVEEELRLFEKQCEADNEAGGEDAAPLASACSH